MTSSVNLHTERRRRQPEETGTSRFFERSTNRADVEMKDAPGKRVRDKKEVGDDDDDDDDDSPKRPMRQMRLDFSNGTLGTKKPFRNPLSRNDDARKTLADVAVETISLLPGLLVTRPDIGTKGYLCQKETLDPKFCPKLAPVTVNVISEDTIDAALILQSLRHASPGRKPVAILNMANAKTAGGGWKYGALAQEEAICYRTSLSLTLKRDFYPMPDDAAIYSPRVMVMRDSIQNGHQVVDCTDPRKLDVISVISCAAVCQPSLAKDPVTGEKTYAVLRDKRLMLEKYANPLPYHEDHSTDVNRMRVVLRTAIRNKNRQLVLGALGCGAFGNPNKVVAALWKSVLQEVEFSGGWWEDIVFAVLGDSAADSNFTVFYKELDGLQLS